jgi:predicted RND superfamily exporter protein
MTALLLALPTLSLLVLGAHFLRAGVPLAVLGVLVTLVLLFVRRRWAAGVAQVVLLLGVVEWARATVVLAGERMSEGRPYGRMMIILGVVAAVTAVSALALRSRTLRRWHRAEDAGDTGGER